ncbi:MAG: hypothetical protein HOD92_07285 [Deltaproteobacteria bacterium]|jgi:hypothetical protein|nr:hypothetical protein [Deltaproteobacteria bacterium]MBT4527943.1 hypothetical protein [Deltaproteobacteria bacterium]
MKYKHYVSFLLLLASLLIGCTSHRIEKNTQGLKIFLKQENIVKLEFVSSINQFVPLTLKKNDNAEWIVKIPGKKTPFRYFYIRDGNFFLPDCKLKEKDDFGSENCIYDPEK